MRVQQWRVTAQSARNNPAHCKKCMAAFGAHELRLQSARATRSTDSYFHVGCLDAVLPQAADIQGADQLSPEQVITLVELLQENQREQQPRAGGKARRPGRAESAPPQPPLLPVRSDHVSCGSGREAEGGDGGGGGRRPTTG